ncbi:MAG: transposase [Pirellulaceae bacterium]
MDEGHGKCWFRNKQFANELHRSILHFHDKRYEIGCFAIMANHCHLVMRPFESIELEDELRPIKSITARFINRHERTTGATWQQESYDRIIRNEEHLYRVVQYISRNPKNAGVPQGQWHRWLNPNWQAAGWNFESQ